MQLQRMVRLSELAISGIDAVPLARASLPHHSREALPGSGLGPMGPLPGSGLSTQPALPGYGLADLSTLPGYGLPGQAA